MSITEVLPVVLVVLFWLVAFVFAWWFTARALRAPIEYEEAHAVEAHETNTHAHTHATH
ncbi:MAG TPA: hypothetical protein VFS83_12395 [Ktedonobacterales bacterium]|nr:hypothetical protein [Ktedonobacterales bacterium]